MDIGSLSYLVRIPAEISEPRELESFVVKVRDGIPIYVRDVASVVYGFEDETTRARLNQQPSVTLTIEKRTGANIIEVADSVKAEVDRRRASLPSSVEVTVIADQSKDIRTMVAELENSIVAGLLLVVAVLMAFLGLRNSLFVAAAIPLSMLISFGVLQAWGYTLNMVVLFSLILVLGMLVDNAIVIVENIYRHREDGADGMTAASIGTREVMVPVMTSTLTTCCAFAPLLFWPGLVGDFMSFLPVTLIIDLTASLAVALVFNPTLCAAFMKSPAPHGRDGRGRSPGSAGASRVIRAYELLLGWLLRPSPDHGSLRWFIMNWVLVVLFVMLLGLGIGAALVAATVPVLASTAIQTSIISCAGAGVAFALQGAIWLVWSVVRLIGGWQPWVTDRRAAVLWGMGVILIGTAAAYGVWGQGLEFFPETSPRQVWIDLEVPSGTNLDTADAIVRQVEMITAETPDLRDLSASVGSTGISLNSPQPTGVVASVSRVTLDLLDNRDRSQDSLLTLEQVRSRIAGVTGAEVTVDKPEDGPPTAKPIVVRIIGDDFGALGELSRTVQDTIRVVPGLVNLTDDYDQGKPEIRVRVNRVQAAVAGVNTREITGAIQTAIRGAEASTYRIGEDEYDISPASASVVAKGLCAQPLYHTDPRGRCRPGGRTAFVFLL